MTQTALAENTHPEAAAPVIQIVDPAKPDDEPGGNRATHSSGKTDLLIWPESAVPKMVRYDEDTYRAVTELAQSNQVWLITSSDDAEPARNGSTNPDDADYFNSAFLVAPDGQLADVYHKRKLVIFGEYIPLVHWLPFIKYLTPIPGSFTPGDQPVTFGLGDLHVNAAPLICFEDSFPGTARASARDDVDFLVNLTNDGWFGDSAAQWQHMATAVFRTVENNLPLIRCSNNGVTCWIDASGRVRDIFHDRSGSVYGVGTMTVDIPVTQSGAGRVPTFYHRHGDWFGWGCVVVAALVSVRSKKTT